MSYQCSGYTAKGVQCANETDKLWRGLFALCSTHTSLHNSALRVVKEQAIAKHMESIHERRRSQEAKRVSSHFVYFIKAGRKIKIGYATDPVRRLHRIRSGTSGAGAPVGLDTSRAKILATIEGDRLREGELHRQFKHLRVSGEWFHATPELVSFIQEVSA